MSVAKPNTGEAVAVTFEYASTDKPGYELPWVHVKPDDPDMAPVWRVVARRSPDGDIVVPPFELTSELRRELSQCLLDAFTRDELKLLIRVSMNTRLDAIVAPNQPLISIVEALIDWSKRTNWTAELVEAAYEAKPMNRRLAAFVDRVRAESLIEFDDISLQDALVLRAETAARWEAHVAHVAEAVRKPQTAAPTATSDAPPGAADGLYDFVARSLQQPIVVETIVDDAPLARTTIAWHGSHETVWFTDRVAGEWATMHMQAVDAAGRTALAVLQRECHVAAAVRRAELRGLTGSDARQAVQQRTPPPPPPALPPVDVDAVRDLPALSIRQPYAEALVSGTQTAHFRAQKTNRRGRILLYAAKTTEPQATFAALDIEPDDLPTGVVVGVAELVDCTETPDGGWAWQFTNAQRLSEPTTPENRPQPVWFYPFAQREDWPDPLVFEWQPVPAGPFPMGDPIVQTDRNRKASQSQAQYAETEQRGFLDRLRGVFGSGDAGQTVEAQATTEGGQVSVADFSMARTPVTNAQYRLFIEAGGYDEARWWTQAGWKARREGRWTQPRFWDDDQFNAPQQPVVGVSWYEAAAFCAWAAEETGEPIRLPTEAEWEKAARGTDGRTYPWGEEEPNDKLCNFNNNVGQTTPVAQYSPQGDSPYGCADMAGNVWEWCASRYANYPYDADDGRNELGGTDDRVVRGGWWDDYPTLLRCAFRDWFSPQFRSIGVGFRCASTAF